MTGAAGRRSHPSARGSLGRRLQDTRARRFVGRTRELETFAEALAGSPGAPRVLLVHGPGGIGKSALLERMADLSAESGRSVARIDADRASGATPLPEDTARGLVAPAGTPTEIALRAARTAVSEAAATAPQQPQVLLVDSVDECAELETMLRHELLPDLPEDVVVVLAGRSTPDQEWTTDPGWRELVDVVRLDPLDPEEAAELLRQRDVPTGPRAAVLRFAAGNPLALSLAADDTGDEGDEGDHHDPSWAPGPELAKALLACLVDPATQLEHATTLSVAALARSTTVELLRAVLEVEEAAAEFTWLSTLPGARVEPSGLQLDELVRRLIDSVHRWRDPAGHEALRRAVGEFHTERVLSGGPHLEDAVRGLAALSHGAVPSPTGDDEPTAHDGGPAPELQALDLGTDLAATVLTLSDHAFGPDARPGVDHWLQRQPEAFSVYGTADGTPVSFLAWLRFDRPTQADLESDPVVAAAWRHVELSRPLSPDEGIAVVRYLGATGAETSIAPTDPRLLRWHTEVVRSARHLAATFVALPRATPLAPCMARLDHHPVPDTGSASGPGPDWLLFEHDWRQVPLATYLQRVFPRHAADAAVATEHAERTSLPTRADFDDALRQLLRQWHDDDAVAANLVTRTPLADPQQADGNPVDGIRRTVVQTIQSMQEDPRQVKYYRALAVTYVHSSHTQEAAATRLGLPFGTFRRHLSKGVTLLSEALWRRLRHPAARTRPAPSTGPAAATPTINLDAGTRISLPADHDRGLEPV